MDINKGVSPPTERAILKKMLSEKIAMTGPELFIQGSNAESRAEMKANNVSGDGIDDSSEDSPTAPFDLILEFMTALMTKEYDEAFRTAEIVLKLEPDNKTVQEFIPILEKLKNMPADDDESDSSDNTSGSSSESGSGNEDTDDKSESESYSDSEEDEEVEEEEENSKEKTDGSESDSSITGGNESCDSDSSGTSSFSDDNEDEGHVDVEQVVTSSEGSGNDALDITDILKKTNL